MICNRIYVFFNTIGVHHRASVVKFSIGSPRARISGFIEYALRKVGLLVALICVLEVDTSVSASVGWSRAEEIFSEALALSEERGDSNIVESKLAEAAFAFEACAAAGIQEGRAFYNAGNAWFKVGEIGRAIAAYRHALAYLPFDEEVRANLEAARALRVDALGEGSGRTRLPFRWVLALISVAWLAFWLAAIVWARFRGAWLKAGAGFLLIFAFGVSLWGAARSLDARTEAVLIVDEAYARKGPSYAYASAFSGPLHNGAELLILEDREGWVKAQLTEGSICWLPSEALSRLEAL